MCSNSRIGINLLPVVPDMGGMRVHVQGLLSGLSELDPPEQIVLFVNQKLAPQLDVPFEVIEISISGSSRPLRYSYEQFVLPFQVRRANIDVLHCPGYVTPLLTSVPTVVTIHDVNYRAVPETFSRLSRFIWSRLVPRSAANADAIITVSEFSRNEITKYIGVSSSKSHVVPNAPSPTLTSSPPSLTETSMTVNPPYFLYVASTHPHKNHETLIRALADLPNDYSLVLVGPERSAHEDLYRVAEEVGVTERIVIPGFVSDTTLATLYANAQLYVHPSRYEGFGIPVLEAMRYETPVACADTASLPEVCDDAAVYFNPDSAADISDTCQKILTDDKRYRSLVQNGKKRVSEYSWRKAAKQTLEVCRLVSS